MSFSSPFALLLTVLLPIIVAMYLLKLRRTEHIISSTYLWQRMVRDIEANAPWQRLRRNLLLLLQLLILSLLIFAIARPFSWFEGISSETVVLIFDTSLSMTATDVKPNRLESAKNQARLFISNLPDDAHSTIISAGQNTQVLIASSQDKKQLYLAIDSIHAEAGESDLTDALQLASALTARQPDSDTLIYSDGRVSLPEHLPSQGQFRYIPIGNRDNNQAISLLSLESGMSPENFSAFIQVENYQSAPTQRRLAIYADGNLIDARDLEIPSHGQVSVINEFIPIGTKVLEAKLLESDDLSIDNQAWVVNRDSYKGKVTLVSHGDFFVETALSLLPNIDLILTSPEAYNDRQNQDTESDLTIFHSYQPTNTNLQPLGSIFYINPPGDTVFFSVNGTIDTPVPKIPNDSEPILNHVSLNQVNILDAAHVDLPDWARPILIDNVTSAPLLFLGETDNRRVAGLSFDPRHSDLPLQVAFPILISNLIDWLIPGSLGGIPNQIRPGQVLTFTPPPGTRTLTITRPDGSNVNLELQDGQVIFPDTNQTGVYEVTLQDDQSFFFAVNLFNPQESDIAPSVSLSMLNELESPDLFSSQGQREWWRPLAFSALIILVLEWLVYNRSVFLKLWHQFKRKADFR